MTGAPAWCLPPAAGLLLLAAAAAAGCGGSHAAAGACKRDADCATAEVCEVDATVAPADLAPLAVTCGEPLVGAAPLTPCTDGGECDHGFCLLGGTCAAPCVADADCGPAERCRTAYVRTGPAVMQPVDACVSAVDVPDGVSVDQRRLEGALTGRLDGQPIGFGAGLTAPRTLTSVLEPAVPSGAYVSTLSTADPSPVLLFDLVGQSVVSRNPPSPFGEPMTVLVPNGPDSVVTAAGYQAVVRTSPPPADPVDLFVTDMVRSDAGTTVDLDLFYVGVESPARPDAPLPDYVASALERVDVILALAGVQVGDVRQHLVVGQLADDLGVIPMENGGDFPDLGRLFTLSAGIGRPSVPIFLVRLVEGTLGIAGAVPGPQGIHGTTGSGIAISVGPVRQGVGLDLGIDLGRVLAHELSHFLGLFHTTESDGFSLEPLSDTPECPDTNDTDGDGVVSPTECDGQGADNLMFWAASGEAMTSEQRAVVTRGSVLR